jgi:hypothetical protein
MKARHIITALSLFGLSALVNPAAIGSELDDLHILQAAQKATSRSDHEAIATYYEDAAKAMHLKMREKKQLLEHYQDKSYLYGRQAQDLQSHTEALARQYEVAVKKNVKEPQLHHQMALNAEESLLAESGSQMAGLPVRN